MEYNFKEIEKKWQKYWKDHHIYQVKEDESKPKYYVLDMFPYPSGAGLHVGHPLGYIASDIYSRYKRLKGFNVLHPMGYDAYGLPAEQYAIQTGQHPAITTEKNINRYREQLDKIGFCYDWSREIRTCDPEYYKWTQWAFIQMFNSYYCNDKQQARPIEELIKTFETTGTEGVNAACSEELSFTSEEWNGKSEKEQQEILMNYRIAYLGDTMVNWCPQLGTVLANDEVSEGVSIRGGYPVEQKVMRQWCLRVSAYAQRLLEGLDKIDWTDSLKETQKNWIGRSEGAEMQFKVVDSDVEFTIFTTRADTVFGVTFMVLAPESDYVKQVVTPDQQEAVNKYLDSIKHRTERERLMDKSVTGVFTGAYAVNPLNNKHIPIYISDYVLAGYGTGAIMAVPAHDSRDYAFAKHFDLPIIPLIEGCDVSEESFDAKEGKMINSCGNGLDLNGMEVKEAIAATKKFIKEKGIGRVKVNYRLRDAIFSRQRYWGEPFPVYYKEGMPYMLDESKLPLELPEVDKFLPTETGEPPLGRAKNWETEEHYPLELCTMPGFAGSSAYYLRDGDMVFGSTSGSFRFNPEEVKAYENTSNLVFTNFRVFYNNITPENNTDILSSRINLVETVKLKHNQNSFSIDFVSVDVYRSGNYVYKYKLEGFDTDWSPADSYMRADYTNIPPGNYKFSVMCIDQNSLSCVARKSVDINILSPFWNTAWAKLLYVILFSTFVYWIMKFYKTRSENLRFNDKINFFINVAHDIRTPLSLVIAPLKDMEKILGEDFPGRYYLNMALKNSNKLYSLVTRLLDFQKMEVALTKPSYSPVDVVSYLIQKADEFSMAGEKKNIIIETSLPSNAIFAKVDFERLDHILDNLISNAIKYSNKEGHVEIRMFLHGKRLFFEVEDNGIGIPRRDHKKILNDFYRTGNAIDSGEVGSGIGLAIARRLARQMNGKLSFTSQENYGSTFRLEIPYIEAADCMLGNDTENSTEQEIVQGENDYQEKECILVVEDGEDMRNYLVNSLLGEYKIFAVKSAEEALDFLQKKVVDVVLSDVMMSTMDGIELCRRLKMNFETSHLIVIMMTASIRHENVISAFESGADDYITKPFDIDVLRFKISNMLHTRRKMQQHYLSSMFLKGNKPAEQESVPLANSFDDEFLKKAIKLVTDNVDNSDFTINELCQKMAMSRTLLYEKLKAITGQSPSEFIRIIRLRYAKELLMSGKYSVPTVATMTGFINAKYFSTVFKKYFGDNPSSIIPKKED